MSEKEGPTEVEIKHTIWECGDCKWHDHEMTECMGSKYEEHFCLHPALLDPDKVPDIDEIFISFDDDETPDWCPELGDRSNRLAHCD